MLPVYRCMDSYPQPLPHQRNHMPYPHHYFPTWEVIPPQMKLEPAKPPETFESWPCNGGFRYPNPGECQGCCTHSQPYGYNSFRPPYSHLPQPPMHSYVPYAHPAYFAPPPPYSVEQGWSDNGKNVSRNHCCGCPNHNCNRKANSTVKIEEHKPEMEQKDSDSPGLVKFPNYPYPVFWIPPSYLKGKEDSKPPESDSFPWKNVKLSNQGEEKKDQNKHGEEKETQLPHPIIWMPGYDKPEEVAKKDLKEINASPKKVAEEEMLPKLKIIPVKVLEKDCPGDKPVVVEDNSENGIHSAVSKESSKPKKALLKHVEESREKSSNNSVNKRSSSPVKTSKLPPVCLRVDPLPRGKYGNGTSRSPSPPKEKHQQESKAKEPTLQETKEGNSKTKEIGVVQIEETPKIQHDGGEDSRIQDQAKMQIEAPVVSNEEISGKTVKERAEIGERQRPTEQFKGEEVAEESKKAEELMEKRNRLSSNDAASVIQSAYRGFQVRRWQPLEKLKQIARVRERVDDVRDRIWDLEASAKHQLDEKRRTVISETIMSLLLQLDTIQGLEPSVREIRKSVARELVCLQEKLDSLATKTTAEEHKLTSTEGLSAEDLSEVANGVDSFMPTEPTSKTEEPEVDSVTERNVTSESNLEEHEDTKPKELSELPLVEAQESVTRPEELVRLPASLMEPTSVPEDENPSDMPLVEDKHHDSQVETSLANEEPKYGDSEGILMKGEGKPEPEPDSVPDQSARDIQLVEDKIPGSEIHVPLVEDKHHGSHVEMPLTNEEPKYGDSEGMLMNGEPKPDPDPDSDSALDQSARDFQLGEDKIPGSEIGVLSDSLMVGEKPSSKLEESATPLEIANDEKPIRVAEVLVESQMVIEEEQPGSQLKQSTKHPLMEDNTESMDGFTQPSEIDEACYFEVEKPTELPLVEKDQYSAVNSEESVTLLSAKDGGEMDSELSSLKKVEADSTRQEVLMPPLVEEGCSDTSNSQSLIHADSTQENDVEIITLKAEDPVLEENGDATCQSLGSEFYEKSSVEPSWEEKGIMTSTTSEAESGNGTHQIDEIAAQSSGSEFSKDGSVVEVESSHVIEDSDSESTEQATEQKAGSGEDAISDTDAVGNKVLGSPKEDGKLVEENEKLKEMFEKLMEAGKQQLMVISDLSGRVKDLERKLTRKKKAKVRRQRVVGSSSIKTEEMSVVSAI